MHKHDLTYLPVAQLVPNWWNPQEQSEEEFQRLCDEMAEVGCILPLDVVPLDDGTYRIIGGEHRWKAAQQIKLDEVPCLLLTEEKWKDEDLQKFVTVRLNAIGGKVNPDRFLALYNEMLGKYGKDALQNLMGYTDSHAWQKLVGGVKQSMKKALPKMDKKMAEQFEKDTAEAKSVEDLSKIINALFAKYGDTVNQAFMIFTHGSQEHIYIAMDKKMRKAMDKVMEYSRTTGEDINILMAAVTQAYMKEAEKRLAAGYEDAPKGTPVESVSE